MAFLDTAGLERLWQQIIAKLGTKADTIHNHNVILEGDVASGATVFDGDGGIVISTNVTSMHGVTTAGTGAAYTATVDGITALTAGVSFIMIPHTNSTTATPTLNVNGLGAKGIRMRGSTATGTAIAASIAAWLGANKPVQITYNGIFWVAEVTRPAASDLSGTVAIANGGTGATDAATALANLGVNDYVVEEGTSGIWYYRKWDSGIAEAWGIAQSSTGAFDWWDSKSYLQVGASPVPRQSYPFTISNPRLTFSLYSLGDVSGFGIAETTQYNTTQYTPEIWTVLGSGVEGYAAMDVTVEYHVVGRWK